VIHQARQSRLAREADKTTVQHIARFNRQRRHATLANIILDDMARLTDQAINPLDHLIRGLFLRSEGQHAGSFQSDARRPGQRKPGSPTDAGFLTRCLLSSVNMCYS